uniref:Ribosome biogenesis protein NOP53 n=1 Tax=Mesocestoides corti TaxID=53468 RepID=A0A5K3EZK7_MESCO
MRKSTKMRRSAKLRRNGKFGAVHEGKKGGAVSLKPILYTRRLKTNKQKKIKQIIPPLWSHIQSANFDDAPVDDGEQKMPSSFREMVRRISDCEKKLNPYRYHSNEGDTEGMRKKLVSKSPKQGKNETLENFSRRLSRDVQEELLKVKLERANDAPLENPETFKSRKTKKALKRLAARKQKKKEFKAEKRRTGFEHLQDKVKFGDVVQAPPVLKTKPKKVGGNAKSKTSTPSLYQLLTT